MGVEANITIESDLPRDQVEQAARACFDRLAQLDAIFSDYKRDSELNNLTKHPINTPTKVSNDLFLIISQSQHISDITNGAFDITIGPYVALWRTARSTGTLPTKEQLADAKQRVGYHLITLNQANQTITLHANNMKLDLGGIAKGYAAQAGVQVLKAQGFPRCLVALAGDIATGDAPLTSEPTESESLGWRIDIDSDHSTTKSLRLKGRSVSTSGDTQQFIDIAGIRYSHIVNPRTGLGAVGTTPVTIVGTDGAIADALATAFTLLNTSERQAVLTNVVGYTTP
ncbi:MAG: FAD:protein FMN transferase [Phycisphaerales bacterium]